MEDMLNSNALEKIAEAVEYLQEHPIEDKQYVVDGKTYNVSVLDIEDFEVICKETIPDFIRRVQPKDDNELSYLLGLHMSEILRKRKIKN